LGGLVGWLLYGRVSLEAGDEDPLAVIMRFLKLKWLYRMVQNSFYLDNIYMAIFVKPLPTLINLSSAMDIGIIDRFIQATGKVIVHVNTDIAKLDEVSTYLDVSAMQSINVSSILAWIDGYIVDEVVNIVGYLGGLLSRMMNQIDERLIDGIINQMAQLTRSLGLYVRKLQNGLISDYLWNAFLMVLLIIASITLLQ
jgi:NADH:ubiquinone oxidoreductase subunit 5 (subunit L)/multisubunit Na+/H+ antiporter MnhA subunit